MSVLRRSPLAILSSITLACSSQISPIPGASGAGGSAAPSAGSGGYSGAGAFNGGATAIASGGNPSAGSPVGGNLSSQSGGSTAAAGANGGSNTAGTNGGSNTAGASLGGSAAQGGRPSGNGGRSSGGSSGNPGGQPATGGSSMGGGASMNPSSGCGKTKPTQVPTSVDVAGTNRTFVMDVPASYDASTPTPVLFAFHGMGTTGTLFRQKFYGNLLSTFGASYIVVHPDALGDPTQWDASGTQDVLFFDALLQLLSASYCVDASRVFVTGHSSGGYFTNALACQRGNVIRGAAPQSGGGPFNTRSCKGAVATMILHGASDTSVLPAQGEKSRDYWGMAAGCDLSSGAPSAFNSVCLGYSACDPAHPLMYCPYAGDHNTWAEAPKVMFNFFESL